MVIDWRMGGQRMSKERRSNKEAKKPATMTSKERKAAKKSKKEAVKSRRD